MTRGAGAVVAVSVAMSVGVSGFIAGAVWLCWGPLQTLRTQLAAGRTWSALPLDLLLSVLASTALALTILWLAITALATLVEVASGLSHHVLEAMTPALVRRVVVVCCGVAVGGGATLAPAAAMDTGPAPDRAAQLLTGLRLPDRVTGATPRADAAAPAAPAAPAASVMSREPRLRTVSLPAPRTYRVEPGECLWSIAADALPTAASTGEIARAWRAIYRHNRSVVGPDPHLLRVGVVLQVPADLLSEAADIRHHTREDAS
jgi:hypothetical protein